MTSHYREHDGIAVITLDNPPVNSLGLATRVSLIEALTRAFDESSVRAIVILGAGKLFSGGADIQEFGSSQATQEPTLPTVITAIESGTKPVVAVVHGMVMGGGLEVALGCHYRLAASDTHVALPEVKLGMLPGAGGTQRLPRAVGLERALNMIVSGDAVSTEELAGSDLFDEIIDGDLLASAVAFAQRIASVRPLPLLRDRPVEHANPEAFLQFARDSIAATTKGLPAPVACVDAIRAAVQKPFDEGICVENGLFVNLINGPVSRALRHAFLAERKAGKIDDIPALTQQREIKRAAVIGAGTMGCGIALSFLNANIPVTLLETKQDALDVALTYIRKHYEDAVGKGKLTSEKRDVHFALLNTALSYADIAEADIVVEAVFEDMSVKETVFQKLDAVVKRGAILATNTSTLDVDRIAAMTGRPSDVIGLHFFSPANVMKLLEVVRGKHTANDVLATAMALAKKIDKTPVVSGVCDGFIGNRMIEQYVRQAGYLLDEGALPHQIDRAIETFGFAMGPFRMSDLAGNDIGRAIRQRRTCERPDIVYSKTADLLCDKGRFGQKTGAGWYDYKPGDRKPYPSSDVADMIVRNSESIGVRRRQISDDEIVERLVYALVNEGARILEEGIASRPSDIDLVYLSGYGFPRFRGGPMFYADTVGLYNVLQTVRRYAHGYRGEAWQPAELLVRLVKQSQRFND
ncbi:3-hydroxyacyl-CoA dehydrogenase NAD-binding domain-containing protein [Burkholderia anthina]|uniref:3-hydroxyacyl-CoA dehydrogenase NAD-binding domain-containing protein n=1 Tax=Burkholderia anthina TaxID=179879 RepID=UPI00158DC0D9|nr:3-hydroxyacyl-CoA dehydrogenase NAD-binding domain-containing protein [Burkholderia anthina]